MPSNENPTTTTSWTLTSSTPLADLRHAFASWTTSAFNAAVAVGAGVAASLSTFGDRTGDFYLDGPGMEDELPPRNRLYHRLFVAVEAAKHLFRESSMPRVEVMDHRKMGVAVVTIKGERMNPTVLEGKDSK